MLDVAHHNRHECPDIQAIGVKDESGGLITSNQRDFMLERIPVSSFTVVMTAIIGRCWLIFCRLSNRLKWPCWMGRSKPGAFASDRFDAENVEPGKTLAFDTAGSI